MRWASCCIIGFIKTLHPRSQSIEFYQRMQLPFQSQEVGRSDAHLHSTDNGAHDQQCQQLRPFPATTWAGCGLISGMHVQVLAFRFTANTSVQLLNSFTVPFVFVMCAPEPYVTLPFLSLPLSELVSFSVSWGVLIMWLALPQ